MARKQVRLQRLSSFGQWVTIKRVSLGLDSRARFQATLPLGVSRLRIAMSVNQAGVGYLAGFSREIHLAPGRPARRPRRSAEPLLPIDHVPPRPRGSRGGGSGR